MVLKGVFIISRKAWSIEGADTGLADDMSPTQKDQRGGGDGEDDGGGASSSTLIAHLWGHTSSSKGPPPKDFITFPVRPTGAKYLTLGTRGERGTSYSHQHRDTLCAIQHLCLTATYLFKHKFIILNASGGPSVLQ